MKNSSLKKDLDSIKKDISTGDIALAIEKMNLLLNSNELSNEILHQESRYSEIRKKIRLGVIDEEFATIESNRIRYAIIELIDEIEKKHVKSSFLGKVESNEGIKKIGKYRLISMLFAIIFIWLFAQETGRDFIVICIWLLSIVFGFFSYAKKEPKRIFSPALAILIPIIAINIISYDWTKLNPYPSCIEIDYEYEPDYNNKVEIKLVNSCEDVLSSICCIVEYLDIKKEM